jgi:hypothetical protein
VDGQGGDLAVRNGRAHRLRPGRQHLATVCPSPHWVHLARRGSRTDLDRCRGAGLGRLQHRRHLGQADRWWPRRRLQPATDRWRQLPRSPLSNRTWAIQAWTGQLLLVIAGSCGDAGQIRCLDGAAYNPAATTWTPIPALAGGAIAPEAAAAWTGSELVIWSATTSKDGLRIRNAARAYNPRTKRWRTLPPAPIAPRRLAAAVWAGDRLLVWGGIQNIRADKLAYPDDGAAYDPRSNRWQPLATAPVPGRAWPLTVWTGDRAIFIGGMNLGDHPRTDRGNIVAITEQGAAYRPAGLPSSG